MKNTICIVFASAILSLNAAVKVSVDSIRQNWPWSPDIVIGFTLSGVDGAAVDIEVEAFSGERSLGKLLPTGDCVHLTEDGSYAMRVKPDVAASNPLVADFKVRLSPVASDPSWDVPLYRIYDLTTEDAAVECMTPAKILSGIYGDYFWSGGNPVLEPGRPIAYTNLVWTGVNQDKYKNESLVMRYMPAEGQTVNICGFEESAYAMPDNYYIGVFETTQRQWNQVMGEFPECTHSGNRNFRPVETVPYSDVRGHSTENYWPKTPAEGSFLHCLRAKTADTPFDLPAAYQLTYAAQAGNGFGAASSGFDTATWPDNTPTVTVVDGVAVNNAAPGRYGNTSTASVGGFAPSSQGIYDIVGNVSEMCVDWNFATQKSQRNLGACANVDPEDPAKPRTSDGSTTSRHFTGSSYSTKLAELTLNYARGEVDPETGSKTIGFRLFLPAYGDEEGECAELEDAVAGESDVCAVIVKPEETAFWRTVTNSTFEVSWEFPQGVQTASLSVEGMGAKYTFDDLTETSKTLSLPSPDTDENVYNLTLSFDDGTTQSCSLGVVRGAQEGVAAIIDYAASGIAWRRTESKAVFPVPFGAVKMTVDGEEYALDGTAGWFGYTYPSGAAKSEVQLDMESEVYENSLIPFSGFILTVR